MPQSSCDGMSTRTAILLAMVAWFAGCVPVEESKTDTAAAPGAITSEALPGPIALALADPKPAKPPTEVTPDKIAAVLSVPEPVRAPEAAPAATPAAAAPPPGPPPVKCPADTVGKWSADVIGIPVYVCKRLTS